MGARRRRWPWLVVAGVAVALGGGALLAHSPKSAPPLPPRPRKPAPATLTAGPVSVRVPGDWQQLTPPPNVPGLALEPGLAAAPGGRGADGIVLAGIAPGAANPALLPSAFGSAPTPRIDTLGAFPAFRYALYSHGQRLTLFSAPTSAGVVVVGCLAPSRNPDAFAPACANVAGSLRVQGATALGVKPDPKLQRGLDRAIPTRPTAGAYAAARRTVASLKPGPRERSAVARLVRALDRTRDAYRALAAATRADRYRAATTNIRSGERDIQAALHTLAAAGYRTPTLRRHSIPAFRPSPPPKPTPTYVAPRPTATPHYIPQPTATPHFTPAPSPEEGNPTPIPEDPTFGN